MRRAHIAVLLLGLAACGRDPPPPATAPAGAAGRPAANTPPAEKLDSAIPSPPMDAIEVSNSHSFNKHADELTAIEVLLAHPEAWEPYTDPIWKEAGFRVRQDAGAVPQRLTVKSRWSSGASNVAELGVAPGGYYLDSGDWVHIITTPPAVGTQEAQAEDNVFDRISDDLKKMLPRPLTVADVLTVLLLTVPVDDEGTDYATAARQAGVTVLESEWGSMSARVSMAYGQLLVAAHGPANEIHAAQLKADIEVVRPFKKRLDQLYEERRAKEEKSINRSGHMVSLTRPEFVSARMENPENWERFKEPNTGRDGFRVKPGVGEQFLAVRAQGQLVPKLQRYAMLPGGYYVQDVDGITIRPTGGK